MEIGIFSRTFETSDLEETYKKMIKHDINHTQFNLSNAGMPTLPEYLDEKKVEKIKAITNAYKIKLDALSGTFNMIDPDENARKKGCVQFEIQCKVARLLGIPIVSLCTGSKNPDSKWRWHDDNLKQSSYDDLMRSTENIIKYAEDNNVILGVEVEASNIINTAERARRYLDTVGSSKIKIIMDGANLFMPEQITDMKRILRDAFDILGNDIILAHAKDLTIDGDMDFVSAGQGVLDYDYYINLLKRVGYMGPLILHGLSESQISTSISFLKEKMANE